MFSRDAFLSPERVSPHRQFAGGVAGICGSPGFNKESRLVTPFGDRRTSKENETAASM